jgi:Flp pilus assembly protein TadG
MSTRTAIAHQWKSFLRRLLRCGRGASTIEFALTAPVVFFAVTMVIEFALMMFVQALLEGGLREAARYGVTGYVPAGITREDEIKATVARNLAGLVDMSTASISELVYPSFSDVGKPEPFTDQNGNGSYDPGEPFTDVNGNGRWDADMGTAGVGGPGDIVLYTVAIDWRPMTPLVIPYFGTNGKIRMKASVAVRNEPYNGTAVASGGGAP